MSSDRAFDTLNLAGRLGSSLCERIPAEDLDKTIRLVASNSLSTEDFKELANMLGLV